MAASTKTTLTPSAAALLATGLKSCIIQNLGPYPVWIGGSNVSAANGLSLPATGTPMAFDLGLGLAEGIYGISESGDSDVRVLTTVGG